MRDPEVMIEILEEMGDKPDGLILLPRTLDMSAARRTRLHHVDLLTDAGLAYQVSDSGYRITNQGYDFLNAVKQDKPRYTDVFKDLLSQGKPVLDAASQVVSIVSGVS